MTEYCRFGAFSVHRRLKKEVDGFEIHENIIKRDNRDFLYLHDLTDCKDVANVLSVYHHNCEKLREENERLKKALKESYINEICENCKYGDYFKTDNFNGGFEWDFECAKKHFGNEHWKCDGLTECNDFELNIGDVDD